MNISIVFVGIIISCNGYFFLIVHDRDKFSNRKQSETNWNDHAMCDYLSEYL